MIHPTYIVRGAIAAVSPPGTYLLSPDVGIPRPRVVCIQRMQYIVYSRTDLEVGVLI